MASPAPDVPPLDAPPVLAESLDLLRRGQQGDRQALEALVARYQDRVRRLVSIRMGAQFRGLLDSLDLAQETWMAALRALPDFEPRDHGSLIRWLARIAENQVLDAADRVHAARRDRRREQPAGEGTLGGLPPAPGPTPSEDAGRRELRAAYDECVAGLPETWREVVLLRDYALLDWPEIGEQLGRPGVRATQELYRRAQLRLGETLRRRLSAGGGAR